VLVSVFLKAYLLFFSTTCLPIPPHAIINNLDLDEEDRSVGVPVKHIENSVADPDPGSGAFLTSGSGFRDG
jgi:hypothetical protein